MLQLNVGLRALLCGCGMFLAVPAAAQDGVVLPEPTLAPDSLTERVAAGDTQAMIQLASRKLLGTGVAEDGPGALALLDRAVAAGDSEAEFLLGGLLLTGEFGIAPQPERALQLLKRHYEHADSDQRRTETASLIGIAYLKSGDGRTADRDSAALWLHRAAMGGHVPAMRYYAAILSTSGWSGHDPEAAVRWLERAVAAGDLQAMQLLAAYYQSGTGGVARDMSRAFVLLRQAADGGESDAAFQVASRYILGRGVEADRAAGFRYARIAAEGGSADGMFLLASLYAEGVGVAQDPALAEQWHRRAAELGQAESMYALARIVATRDDEETRYWLIRSAEAGHVPAMYLLGRLAEAGHFGPDTREQALRWYRAAADAGMEKARDDVRRLEAEP